MKGPSPAPGAAPVSVADLLACGDARVRVRLRDGGERTGRMRTELLSARAISVYLAGDGGTGETIYLDEIAGIERLR